MLFPVDVVVGMITLMALLLSEHCRIRRIVFGLCLSTSFVFPFCSSFFVIIFLLLNKHVSTLRDLVSYPSTRIVGHASAFV
jgi:hypothetical protein